PLVPYTTLFRSAHVLGRLEPADVADGVGLVEVEDQAGLDQVTGTLADLDRAPRGGERGGAVHRAALAGRGQRGAQHVAVATGQVHAGVVDQRRLVDGDVQPVAGAQGQRGLRGADLAQRGTRIQVFLAVPLERRDPPGGGVVRIGQGELGQLLADAHLARGRLGRELVAEADAIVVHAEHHVDPARGLAGGGRAL